jgi:hypothetical protein
VSFEVVEKLCHVFNCKSALLVFSLQAKALKQSVKRLSIAQVFEEVKVELLRGGQGRLVPK